MLDKMSARCAALNVASGDKKYIDGTCVLEGLGGTRHNVRCAAPGPNRKMIAARLTGQAVTPLSWPATRSGTCPWRIRKFTLRSAAEQKTFYL
jgi:hypothetical protein